MYALQIVKYDCLFLQSFDDLMIYAHTLCDIFHITGQIPGVSRNTGDSTGAVIDSFGDRAYGIRNIGHGSFKTFGALMEFVHDSPDVGRVLPILASGLHKRLELEEDGLIVWMRLAVS